VRACGALGRFDLDTVERVAKALSPTLRIVHRDERSVLYLDCSPVSWTADESRGFAWSPWRATAPVRSWEDAACGLGANGLVVDRERRYLHSTVSGFDPLYWTSHGGAAYFATAIDPLVGGVDGPVTVDWETWAAIFCLGHPLGERTPFAEVRRLPPFARLVLNDSAPPRVEVGRWPWAEVEPRLDVASGTPAVVARLRESVSRVPGDRVACLLSGGFDSRLLLSLLCREQGRELRAFTHDQHRTGEARLAKPVASVLGVPITTRDYDPGDFPADLRRNALLGDYQRPGNTWQQAAARLVGTGHDAVVAGHPLDGLMRPASWYMTEEMLQPGPQTARALWERLRGGKLKAGSGAAGELDRAFAGVAERAFLREADAWLDHPSQVTLTFYRTRVVNRTALGMAIAGREIPALAPFTDDALTRSILAVSPRQRFPARLYDPVFAAVNPAVGGLPSTNRRDLIARFRHTLLPQRLTDQERRAYSELLRSNPLRDHVSPALRVSLARGWEGMPGRGTSSGEVLRAFAQFALWHERYRDRLGELDVCGDLGLRRRRATRG
jgi:Asparagine synthase